MHVGQQIYRRKWTGLFFLDPKLTKPIKDLYYFDINNAHELREFHTCKWPCLLIGGVGSFPNCWVYSICDKKNI